jgi:hypothetical protein
MSTELLRFEPECLESLQRWLTGLPSSTLAGWLMDAAMRDDSLRVVLRCEQAQAAANDLDVGAFREAIEHFTANLDDITWRESSDFGNRLESVVGLLSRALDRGQAIAVIELCEFALHRTELAAMAIQDSETWSGHIRSQLSALHLRACQISPPDPVALATRCFQFRIQSDLGWFDHFPRGYRELLGPSGVATLERLLTESLEYSQPDKISRGHLDAGLAGMKQELGG